jgi:hypothetical protein
VAYLQESQSQPPREGSASFWEKVSRDLSDSLGASQWPLKPKKPCLDFMALYALKPAQKNFLLPLCMLVVLLVSQSCFFNYYGKSIGCMALGVPFLAPLLENPEMIV